VRAPCSDTVALVVPEHGDVPSAPAAPGSAARSRAFPTAHTERPHHPGPGPRACPPPLHGCAHNDVEQATALDFPPPLHGCTHPARSGPAVLARPGRVAPRHTGPPPAEAGTPCVPTLPGCEAGGGEGDRLRTPACRGPWPGEGEGCRGPLRARHRPSTARPAPARPGAPGANSPPAHRTRDGPERPLEHASPPAQNPTPHHVAALLMAF
jgi:hypothetical protein